MKKDSFTTRQWIAENAAHYLSADNAQELQFLKICDAVCEEQNIKPRIMKIGRDEPNVYCHVRGEEIDIIAATPAMMALPPEQMKLKIEWLVKHPEKHGFTRGHFDAHYYDAMIEDWIKTKKAWRPRPEVPKEEELRKAFAEACEKVGRKYKKAPPELLIYSDLHKNAYAYRYTGKKGVKLVTATTGLLTLPYERMVCVMAHELGHGKDRTIKLLPEDIEMIGAGAAGFVGATVTGVGAAATAELMPPIYTFARNTGAHLLDKTHLLSHISSIPVHYFGAGTMVEIIMPTAMIGAASTYAASKEGISKLAKTIVERKAWPNELWSDRVGAKAAGKEATIAQLRDLRDHPWATAEEMEAIYPPPPPPPRPLEAPPTALSSASAHSSASEYAAESDSEASTAHETHFPDPGKGRYDPHSHPPQSFRIKAIRPFSPKGEHFKK